MTRGPVGKKIIVKNLTNILYLGRFIGVEGVACKRPVTHITAIFKKPSGTEEIT